MVSFLRFIFGYVKIKIIGDNPELFVNHLISKNISVWNIKSIDNVFTMCVSVKDYLKIRSIRQDILLSYSTRILEKCGLRFVLKNSKLRSGVFVGIFLVVAINVLLSNYIWQIEVSGNKYVSKEKVLKVCKEFGLSEGIPSKRIDTYDLPNKIALKLDKIAWMSLNVEGSKLTINISEEENAEQEDLVPSSIVASRDGTIYSIIEKRGTQNVNAGQTVRKGEVLISCVEAVGNVVRYVSASGEVLADTHHKFCLEIDKNYRYKIKNNNYTTKTVFEFFGIKIPLYLTGPEKYDESFFETKSLELFGKELPITVKKRSFSSFDIGNKLITEKEAENIALASFVAELQKGKVLTVLDSDVKINEDENKYYVTINAFCRENIGEKAIVDVLND